jgi:hypothetical protein
MQHAICKEFSLSAHTLNGPKEMQEIPLPSREIKTTCCTPPKKSGFNLDRGVRFTWIPVAMHKGDGAIKETPATLLSQVAK